MAMINLFDKRITCCYLYPITKYGYPPAAEKTLNYIEEMHSLGFASIELEGIREKHLQLVYEQRFSISDKLKQLNTELPYFCAVLPGLSSFEEKVRNKNMELFEKGCQVARLLNCKGILDNAPLPPYQFPDDIPLSRHYGEDSLRAAFLPEGFIWKKYWDVLIDTYRTLCETAERYDLTYQLHPAAGVLASTSDGFLYFHDAVKKDNLRFNLDTANLFSFKENLPLSILRLKDHIDYIHFSDNRGFEIEHLPPGKGRIEWARFFETLETINFSGNIGIDVGGEESKVENLDDAYKRTAEFLEIHWLKTGIKED